MGLDTYPIPSRMDFVASMIFSKIDLKKGFDQIPMSPREISETVITMPFHLFEFTRMTFSMWNTKIPSYS